MFNKSFKKILFSFTVPWIKRLIKKSNEPNMSIHLIIIYHKFGRLKLWRKIMQLISPRAWTTSSFTLAVAVAVRANTGILGNFCFKIPRPWRFKGALIKTQKKEMPATGTLSCQITPPCLNGWGWDQSFTLTQVFMPVLDSGKDKSKAFEDKPDNLV